MLATTSFITYAQLSPKDFQRNEAIFAGGDVFGVGITLLECLGKLILNVLPTRHQSHLDAAMEADVGVLSGRQRRLTGVVIKPDIDTVGALAVIQYRLRTADRPLDVNIEDRIAAIVMANRHFYGKWYAQPLPTRKYLWAMTDGLQIATMRAVCSDNKLPLGERVDLMEDYLTTGKVPHDCAGSVLAARESLVLALESGEADLYMHKGVAVVQAEHKHAVNLGFCLSPVVVCFNPKFHYGGSTPIRKFTVAQYGPGYCNFEAAVLKLNYLELGWGGSDLLAGSPQGKNSVLELDEVVAVMAEVYKRPWYRRLGDWLRVNFSNIQVAATL